MTNKYLCSRNKDFDDSSVTYTIYADYYYDAAIAAAKEIDDYNGDINANGREIYVKNETGKIRMFSVTVDVQPRYHAAEVI
jgi:hypothetical protein